MILRLVGLSGFWLFMVVHNYGEKKEGFIFILPFPPSFILFLLDFFLLLFLLFLFCFCIEVNEKIKK